ncbi:MAG: DUF2723 domain-containing protein [Kiritimatiellae bacterium]|nr:DUF2723 domain-containing protein [Kiritimatiellia bacterium]
MNKSAFYKTMVFPLAGAMAFLIPLVVYLLTLAPTVTFEDSGSFIAAAYHLGVAHPPGYPLWCLVAHAFTHLPVGSVAQRVHLCSAVFAAATALMIYLTALRLTRDWIAALVAALAMGFSRLLWSQAVIAEVYALNAFLTIVAVYCVIRWREQFQPGWLYTLALTIGMGLTNHLLLGLIAPVLAGWLVIPHWRRLFKLKVLVICALLFTMGFSVYAYLPLRARADPPVNWDNPRTLAKTLRHIRRTAYYTEAENVRYSGKAVDIWRYCAAAVVDSRKAFTWPLMALAIAGVFRLWRGRRDLFWMSWAIIIVNVAALNIILKAPSTPNALFTHRVFYIPGHIMLALWIAYGCAWLLAGVRYYAGVAMPIDRQPDTQSAAGIVRWPTAALLTWPQVVSLVLAVCLAWTLTTNYPYNDKSRYRMARNLGLDFLDSAPPKAGLLLVTDDVLFVCVYLKWVEGLRPDIELVDPFFGYRGGAISAVISDMPATPELVKYFPALQDVVSVPCGLGYRLIKADLISPVTYQSLLPLSRAPHDPDLPHSRAYDPDESDTCARYARYHARLGAKLMLSAQNAEADAEFSASERLRNDDPYACFLLASIYQHFGLHRDRVIPMLEDALDSLDRNYDPADYRFYPITRRDIERALIEMQTRPGVK